MFSKNDSIQMAKLLLKGLIFGNVELRDRLTIKESVLLRKKLVKFNEKIFASKLQKSMLDKNVDPVENDFCLKLRQILILTLSSN